MTWGRGRAEGYSWSLCCISRNHLRGIWATGDGSRVGGQLAGIRWGARFGEGSSLDVGIFVDGVGFVEEIEGGVGGARTRAMEFCYLIGRGHRLI